MKKSEWVENWHEIRVVFGKDLIEVLRDYRTLLIMIIMPVVIYPALLVLPSRVAQHLEVDIKTKKFHVCILGDSISTLPFFQRSQILSVVKVSPYGDPAAMLQSKMADIVVQFPAEFSENVEKDFQILPKVTVFYDARKDQNLLAVTEVRTVLNYFRADCVKKRFKVLGVEVPQRYEMEFAELKKGKDQSLASEPVRNILPFLLFTMLTIAIIYPALDVITGERERNTLLLILMTPTERRNVMFGKFLVVCLIGLAAMLIGLASLYVFVNFGVSRESKLVVLEFPLKAVFMCLLVSIPLVVTLSSLSIMLASWCKTFQQGQGYFVPFLIVFMGATSVCSLPELKLSSGIAFIPIANMALSLKELLSGNADPAWVAVAFTVSIGFAFYVTYLASSILDSERLLFGVADSYLRRRSLGNFTPEVGALTVVVFLLMFYVGQSFQMWDLIVGTILTQALVILLPAVLLLRYLKLPLAATMSLRAPHPLHVLAAFMITPLCILANMMVYQAQSALFPAPEAFTTMFTRLIVDNGKPLWLSILGIAAAPGICEELLFRGAILGLLKPKLKPASSCLAVGAIFGLFHMSIFRFLPTAFLGVILTGLTLWTGSIIPSMIVHVLNNATAVAIAKFNLEPVVVQYWPAEVVSGLVALLIFKKVGRSRSENLGT